VVGNPINEHMGVSARSGHTRPCHHICIDLQDFTHIALGFELDEIRIDSVDPIDKRSKKFRARDRFFNYIADERIIESSPIINKD
jgi:hypothetical protein